MAAKPPKPPGNFLKSLLNQNNNKQQQQQQLNYNNNNNNEQQQQEIEGNSENINSSATTTTDNNNKITATKTTTTTTKKTNCNCSNISIMHLFHEMKQEFPTIPDTIVAQCVNENCHQRENCIQMLRNELELNPIPVQSYPAKVLHPPQQQHQQPATAGTTTTIHHSNNTVNTPTAVIQKPPLQQKPQLVQQKPPLKPLKPIRIAPLKPPIEHHIRNSPQLQKSPNLPLRNTNNKNILHGGGGGVGGESNNVDGGELNDMPIKNSPLNKQTQPLTNNTTNINAQEVVVEEEEEVNNNENINQCVESRGGGVVGSGESIERNLPRARPTTLNLNTHEQKQQRQRLNIQLQQHFQEQRNKQQQHQQHQHQTHITKPLRKAPLPPIAPKPSQFQLNSSVNNHNFNDSLSSNHTSPLSESEISVSVSLSTPSPTSSSSSLFNIPTAATTHHTTPTQQQHYTHNQQTKSPIRHRSVITLQPEPPYTRDFTSVAPAATSTTALATTTASSPGSQKSFTSVNLTLRPPVTPTSTGSSPITALQPSTIDITAGPGFSGASSGGKSLHYSSTSYDARLGYQQNFQITVTDEGGVFSASRIRPQQRNLNQVNICENQYDGDSGVDNNSKNNNNNNQNYVNSLYAEQQQNLQQQQQLYLLQHQQFHNNNVVALQHNIQNSINSTQGGGIGGGGVGVEGIGGNMCVPPQQAVDGYTAEIIERQKKRRDKLAAALRENKKRLGQEEQEINLITGPIPSGLSERLDIEIQKLRTDCQAMLRSSNPFTQQSQQQQQQQLAINQSQPQPFPRQRPARAPPRPPPPRQTSLDFIQHHSQSSTPHTPPAASLPNLNIYNTPSPILAQQYSPLQHQHQQLQHSNSISPSFYHHQQQQQQQQLLHQQHQSPLGNGDIYPDTDEGEYQDDDNDEEYEELVESWECNMCTFRNHPQLNICEACENVRILPGMLPNFSRAISNNSATSVAAAAAVASPSVGLLSVPSTSSLSSSTLSSSNTSTNDGTVLNANTSSANNGLTTANGNLEHDTNMAQQQLQHLALHT